MYVKWLQLNPAHARSHRLHEVQVASNYLAEGSIAQAIDSQLKATEIALAILLVPLDMDQVDTLSEDISVFGFSAIQVAKLMAYIGNTSDAISAISYYRRRLKALQGLFACRPILIETSQTIDCAMGIGIDVYHQSMASNTPDKQLGRRHYHETISSIRLHQSGNESEYAEKHVETAYLVYH